MNARRNSDDRQAEIFGSPAASAIWPNPNTVSHVLRCILLRGESVIQPDFKASWRLAAEAHRLRELGWPVISEPVSHAGTKRKIARYRLSPSAITAARLSKGGPVMTAHEENFCRVEFFSSRCVLPDEARYQAFLISEIVGAANEREKYERTRALFDSLRVYIVHACGGR